MPYGGWRPGLSPAAATLIARGDIRKHHLILDVGCGTGTDSIILARWGFRRVIGIDDDPAAIGIARRRATRLKLNRRVQFLVGRPEYLPHGFAGAAVDVVLHTLVGNNLRSGFHSHFRAIARVMKPDGILVVTVRLQWRAKNDAPGGQTPVKGMRPYFRLMPSVTTHLAELTDRYPYAPIAVFLGKPRHRASRRPSK